MASQWTQRAKERAYCVHGMSQIFLDRHEHCPDCRSSVPLLLVILLETSRANVDLILLCPNPRSSRRLLPPSAPPISPLAIAGPAVAAYSSPRGPVYRRLEGLGAGSQNRTHWERLHGGCIWCVLFIILSLLSFGSLRC